MSIDLFYHHNPLNGPFFVIFTLRLLVTNVMQMSHLSEVIFSCDYSIFFDYRLILTSEVASLVNP